VLEVAHLFVGTQLTAVLGPQLFAGTLTACSTVTAVLRAAEQQLHTAH
jgi:hypothetical protein